MNTKTVPNAISKKISDLNAENAKLFVENELYRINPRTGRNEALITTSQIRKFLSAVNCLENKISMFNIVVLLFSGFVECINNAIN